MLVGLDVEKEHSARIGIQHECTVTTMPLRANEDEHEAISKGRADLQKVAYKRIITTSALIFSNHGQLLYKFNKNIDR